MTVTYEYWTRPIGRKGRLARQTVTFQASDYSEALRLGKEWGKISAAKKQMWADPRMHAKISAAISAGKRRRHELNKRAWEMLTEEQRQELLQGTL